MMSWIKENKLELALTGVGLTIAILGVYFFKRPTFPIVTNIDNIVTAIPNVANDTVDILIGGPGKESWTLLAVDYGDAQVLSAEIVDSMSVMRPA